MPRSLNELNNIWINAGHKVSDLNAEMQQMLVDDTVSAEQIQAKQQELATAKAVRDAAHEQLVDAQAEVAIESKAEKPKGKDDKKVQSTFIKDFKAMMRGDYKIMNAINSSTDENGEAIGLTIPVDVQTAIHTLVRRFDSLQQYVNVERVTMPNGSRVYEKMSEVTPLTNLDTEDEKIPEMDAPKLALIKYLIKRYGGILTLTNSLLKDTAENLLAYLENWIAKKVVVTRNQAIINVLDELPAAQKKSVTTIDDLKDVKNVQLDPAIVGTSMFLTNQSGFNILDKVKRFDGSYLIQPDPTSPTGYILLGLPIAVAADRWLKNKGTAQAPKFPLFIGDLKQTVTLYDREQMSLLTTNIGGGAFETDTTKTRVIDRFDVKLIDNEATVFATFTGIANEQQGTTTP